MLERRLRVTNTLGLHARAAAQLVRLASTFQCSVTLRRLDNGVTANAKSILSVLHMAAGIGVWIAIETEGDDEAAALSEVEKLFSNDFGER